MGRFIDCHAHLLLGGRTLTQLDLSGVSSREEFEAAIRAEHERLPAGQWLEAFGWDQGRWGGEMPSRQWLQAAGDRPVVAYRMDQHACVVNDAVLSMIGSRESPEGGEMAVDEHGESNGLMLEQAAWSLVNPLVPAPSVERRREMLRAACRLAASLGLGAVGTMEYYRDVVEVYEPLRAELPVRVAVTLLDRGDDFDPALAFRVRHDERLWINGFKSFADGTLGNRTARMLEPYEDSATKAGGTATTGRLESAGGDRNRGVLMERALDGSLRDWAREVLQAGLSPSIHAIGDEALRVALDAVDPVDPHRRTRFEHCQTVHPDDIPRFRGRLVSMQPLHRAFDREPALRALGAWRMERFFPFRGFLEHGAILGFGSDWPIVSLDPQAGLREATTPRRRGARNCVSAEVACEHGFAIRESDARGGDRAAGDGPEWHAISCEEALAAYTTDAERFLGTPRAFASGGARR